jgi:hypothetical protein
VFSIDDHKNNGAPDGASGNGAANDFTLASDDVLEKAHAVAEQIQERVRNLVGEPGQPISPST